MKIYALTSMGELLSHSTRSPNTDEWRVIHYLARHHAAAAEKIEADLGIAPSVLARLSAKHIITQGRGVSV